MLAALLGGGALAKRPTAPGANRRLLFTAAWLVPAGYFLAAVFPAHPRAALHVTFIGGFALLALAVGAHVVVSHAGREDLKAANPWPLVACGGLLLGAMVPRALVDYDPARFFTWLGLASAMFTVGTALWLVYLAPLFFARGQPSRAP